MPKTARGRQLDILARQLLAQRAGLEAMLDQLDAGFAMLHAMQLEEDMRGDPGPIETPGDSPESDRLRVFGGARRREAEGSAASGSPTPGS